jgi:hypothetical protein
LQGEPPQVDEKYFGKIEKVLAFFPGREQRSVVVGEVPRPPGIPPTQTQGDTLMATITPKNTASKSAPATNNSAVSGKENTMTQTAAPALQNPVAAPASNAKREVSPQAKEALAAFQAAQKAAKATLVTFLYNGGVDNVQLPEDVRKAMEVIVPNKKASGGSKSGGSKSTVLVQLAELFGTTVGATVSLMDIFKKFRMGEGEMRIRIRNMIYDRKPEERLWISYNADAESYKLEGIGVNPPKGWKGVLPKAPKAPEAPASK